MSLSSQKYFKNMITFNEIPAAIEKLQADLRELICYIKGQGTNEEASEFVTRKELAQMLQINFSTIHHWVKAKRITPIHIGGRVYFSRKEILSFIKKTK